MIPYMVMHGNSNNRINEPENRTFTSINVRKQKIISGISTLFFKKNCAKEEIYISLRHENPPSLSTMLKCAGRFFMHTLHHGNNNTIW